MVRRRRDPSGGGYLFLALRPHSAVHVLVWGCAHERDHESVYDAIRVAKDDIYVECGTAPRCGNRQMGVSMPTGWPLRGDLPFRYGVCDVQGRRCARLHLFMRRARQTMSAPQVHHWAHIVHGHDRGCGAHGANGMGRRPYLVRGRRARAVDIPRMWMGHIGGLRRIRRAGLGDGQTTARGRCPDDAVVRAAQGRAKRAVSPNPVTALSAWVVAA